MNPLSQTTLCLLVATMFAACSGLPVGEITPTKDFPHYLTQGNPIDSKVFYRYKDPCFRLTDSSRKNIYSELVYCRNQNDESRVIISIPGHKTLMIDQDYENDNGIEFDVRNGDWYNCKGSSNSLVCSGIQIDYFKRIQRFKLDEHIEYFNQCTTKSNKK